LGDETEGSLVNFRRRLDVAVPLRNNVDEAAFDRSVALLPRAAVRFWHA